MERDGCGGCGACCREQGSPPGFAMISQGRIVSLRQPISDDSPWAEDWELFRSLPLAARREIADYTRRLEARRHRIESGSGESADRDGACIWLDLGTQRCRWYEFRPTICRDFEPGSEECQGWRDLYQIEEPAFAFAETEP